MFFVFYKKNSSFSPPFRELESHGALSKSVDKHGPGGYTKSKGEHMFFVFLPGGERMGQATRPTKLPLDLGQRTQGGANTDKRALLDATVHVLNAARAFYVDFFLAHAEKLSERVSYYSEKHLEMRERAISANELLTWAEFHTVETKEHPHPWPTWNFSERFPDMPFVYRRSVIKDAIGKVRAYLSNRSTWAQTGKQQGKPGLPG